MKKFLALTVSVFFVASLTVPAHSASSKWTVYQKTLAAFSSSATTLTSQQKSQVKAAVEANPNAEKFICTGIRYYSQPMSINIMVRKRAKAACEYAKELNPNLSTWYQNKPTQARSYAGKVLLTIKSPSTQEAAEPPTAVEPAPESVPTQFQDPWVGVELYETDNVSGVLTVGDGLGWRISETQDSAELYKYFSPQEKSTSWYECPSQLPRDGAVGLSDCTRLNSFDWFSIQERHKGKSFAMQIEIDWVRQITREFVQSKTYISQRSPMVGNLPSINIESYPSITGTWETGSQAYVQFGSYSGGSTGIIQGIVSTYQCLEKLPERQVLSPATFNSSAAQCRSFSQSGPVASGELFATEVSGSGIFNSPPRYFTAVIFVNDSRQGMQVVLQARDEVWEHPLKKASAECQPSVPSDELQTSLSTDSNTLTLNWKTDDQEYRSRLLDCLERTTEMPDGIRTAIDFTSAIQGVKTASWGRLLATWAYSPSTGLVMKIFFTPPS